MARIVNRIVVGGAAVALLAFLGACHHRIPVPAGDAGVTTPDVGTDGPIVIPDGAPDAGCPVTTTSVRTHRDSKGNMTFITRNDVRVQVVGVPGANAKTAAFAADVGNSVAAAALTYTVGNPAQVTDARKALTALQQRVTDYLAANSLGTLTVRGSGTGGTSADGYPDVKAAVWLVELKKADDAWGLRAHLLAAALVSEPSKLGNLPRAPSGAGESDKLIVELSVVLRGGGQIALSLAVATQRSFDDTSLPVNTRVDDLGGGSALGRAGLKTNVVCDEARAQGQAKADIIWIVDESGSMNDNRADIVNNANRFFAKAKAAGLDFRMGVAGMKNPAKGAFIGKFCSRISSDTSDDGGEDRFLTSDESAIFSACVKNPPYFEGGAEYGLAHAYHAVKDHLPRKANDPRKIRLGAELVLIIVTDETPQELKTGGNFAGKAGFLSYSDYRSTSCSLTVAKANQVTDYLKPWFDLFSGKDDPQARTAVHVIGGTCKNACKAEVAYGYQQLAQRFGGQVGDVCQSNLGATLDLIVESIIAAASPRKLRARPISSTLVVEVNGVRLARSRQKGFLYNVAANTLSFISVKVGPTARVIASYRRMVP